MFGKPLLEHRDHLRGVVHRQRRLRHIGELVRVVRHEGRGLLRGLDEAHRARRQLPHGAGDLGVAGMADQDDLAAAPEVDFGFAVDLGDQRAGRVDGDEIAPARLFRHRLRHAMGGKHDRRVGVGNLVQLFDEHRALLAQAVHDIAVVDDLVAHIDRLAVHGERPLDRVDGAHHPGAKAARRAQHHFQGRLCKGGFGVGCHGYHVRCCPRRRCGCATDMPVKHGSGRKAKGFIAASARFGGERASRPPARRN